MSRREDLIEKAASALREADCICMGTAPGQGLLYLVTPECPRCGDARAKAAVVVDALFDRVFLRSLPPARAGEAVCQDFVTSDWLHRHDREVRVAALRAAAELPEALSLQLPPVDVEDYDARDWLSDLADHEERSAA